MLHACLDMKAIILGKYHYVLYFLVLAMQVFWIIRIRSNNGFVFFLVPFFPVLPLPLHYYTIFLNKASVSLTTAKNAADRGWGLEASLCTRPCWPSCWCRWPSRSTQDHNRFPDPLNSRPSGRWWQSRACNWEVKFHLYFSYFVLYLNCTLMSMLLQVYSPFAHSRGLCHLERESRLQRRELILTILNRVAMVQRCL